MPVKTATFDRSFPDVNRMDNTPLPEFAFIGRSNVGKSSLINMLVERKGLAHTSNVPGKTQHLNFYQINEEWYLVDLPGYGYARVPKKLRQKWQGMIRSYLLERPALVCVFVLIDSNIPPQANDLNFINWLGEHGVPFIVIFTKTDRKKPAEIEAHMTAFREKMLESWESLPLIIPTSAEKHQGRDDVLDIIAETLERLQA